MTSRLAKPGNISRKSLSAQVAMKNKQECDNINDSIIKMILLAISKASSAIMQMEKYKGERRKRRIRKMAVISK